MTSRRNRYFATFSFTAAASMALSSCVTSGTGSSESSSESSSAAPAACPAEDASGPLTIQSRLTAGEGAGLALETAVKAFNDQGGGQVEINVVNNETFRDQLPTYLTSENPPDVYTYYGGANLREFADAGQVLDISDVMADADGFTEGLLSLSKDSAGKIVMVPTSYYWLPVYYKKSLWAEVGVEPPETWDELIAVSKVLDESGVAPVGIGLSDSAWLSSAWFDAINSRVNGTPYHLDLLAGDGRFDDPEVEAVFDKWDEIQPYFDENAAGLTFSQAVTDFTKGKTGMFLAGSWLQFSLPPEELDDYGFFRFPIIDPSVPIGEEAPTDGFIASAKTDQCNLAKEFLAYLATPEAQAILFEGDTSGTILPANSNTPVKLGEAALQGQEILADATSLSQYFNRDSSDALQATADQALTQYITGAKDLPTILREWQAEAETARAG